MRVRRYRAKNSDISFEVFSIIWFFSLVLLAIILAIKIGLIIGAILLVVVVIGIACMIVKSIAQAINAKYEKKIEIKRKKNFLHSGPPIMRKRKIVLTADVYPETRRIMQQFEEFVEHEDILLEKQAYRDWLVEKYVIQKQLAVEIESQQDLSQKIIQAGKEIEEMKKSLGKYTLNWYNISWLKNDCEYNRAFVPLQKKLNAKSNNETLNCFLQDIPKAFYSGFQKNEYIFTPLFVLKYDSASMRFEIIEYKNLITWIDIDTELRENNWSTSDEIAVVDWDYERKDGGPDLRYKNNCRQTYVYRGTVYLQFDSCDIEFDFPNKTLAEKFQAEVQHFLRLTQISPYSDDIRKLLNGDTTYFIQKISSKSVDEKEYEEDLSPGMIKEGLMVVHITFGKGKITNVNSRYMTVEFDNYGSKKFKYPDAIQQDYFRLYYDINN